MNLDNYIKEVEERFREGYKLHPTNEKAKLLEEAYNELMFIAPDSVLNFLTDKIKEAWEGGKEYAYNRSIVSCNENETSYQVKDDIENIMRKPEVWE